MEELKACPFCGGEAELYNAEYPKATLVSCGTEGCPMQYGRNYATETDAIKAWNRRAEPENKPLTMERLGQMDGEPVWIALLNIAKQPTCEVITKICEDGIHTVGAGGSDYASFGLYAKTWLAYASKPEGSETT